MPSMPWILSFECKKVKSLQAKDLCFALFGSRPRHLDLIVIHSSPVAKNECKCCQCIAGSHHSSNYPQQMSLIFAMLMQLRWFPQILSCKVEARSKTSPSQPRSASYPRSTWWWFLSSHYLLMISPGCCRHNVTTLKPTRIIGSLWITGQIIRSVGFWNAKSASKAKPTNSTVSPTCSVASWSQLRRTTAPKPKTSKTSKTL